MRRWGYIATFSVILISLPLFGQRGGGGRVSAGSGFAGHSSGSIHSGSFHGGASHSGSFGGGSFGHGSGVTIRSGSGHGSRGLNGRRLYYPYYPFSYYPLWGDYGFDSGSSDNQTADAYGDSSAQPQGPYREDSGLQRDVQALSGKIDRLQSDVEARNRPKEQEPETALVFRDKHVEQVRNYAISGGTLWVLNESAAKKIPLTQLDIDATVKMNDDRGVDFQVPAPALSITIMN
jgi:hypothetical protein